MRIAIVGLLAVAACASGHAGGAGPGDDDDTAAIASLSISPSAIDVTVENGVAAHKTFTAILTYRDGTTKDVTGTTQFAIDSRFGTFDHNSLSIGVAVHTQVFGIYSDAEINATASADVIARVHSLRVVAPLADTTPSRFADTATVTGAPALVYPHDDARPDASGVVLPRNLGDFELHWRDALGDDAFELSLSTDDGAGGLLSDVRVYVPGGNAGGTAGWAAFLPAEWKAAVGTAAQVTYRLRGANPATPGMVSATPAYAIPLSETDVDGAVYYFATQPQSTAAAGIYRHDLAAEPGVAAQAFLTTAQTGGHCAGCHAISRDGSKLTMDYDLPPASSMMVDVASAAIAAPSQRWSYATFTPDNQQLLAITDGTLYVRDAQTLAILAQMDSSAAYITQPDLSADGGKLVYVRPLKPGKDWSFRTGEIYWRTYDEAHARFGPEQKLISDAKNNFNPSWSPDGLWVAFNKNDDGTSDSSYNDGATQVWVMAADGTHPTALTAANAGTPFTNTSVRWAPTANKVDGAAMFWLTFTSKRDFGVRIDNGSLPLATQRAQLWMAPFFPERIDTAPSATAFRLPFQDVLSSNQTPQWAKRIPAVVQ